MSQMLSALGEASGMKPEDDVIGLAAVIGAKAKAKEYLGALLETSTPELRHILASQLQEAITEHEQMAALAIQRGWYKAGASPVELLNQSAAYAGKAIE